MLSATKGHLIGVFLAFILWGIYLTLFLRTLGIFFRKPKPGFAFAYLAGTAVALFILIPLVLGVDMAIVVQLLIPTKDGVDSVKPELAQLGSAVYVSITVIADVFVVYRVFAVWSRSLIVTAVPSLLCVAGIVIGGALVADVSARHFSGSQSVRLLTTFYCTTLVLNVLCTFLIATKLYISERQTALSSSLRLRWTSVVVIESAALYSACLVVIVVSNIAGADGIQILVLSMTAPIIGLNFSLIIVRIASGGGSDKTFTSINVDDRGTALQFARGHRTTYGDESEDRGHANGGRSARTKISAASITPATVQPESGASISAPANDTKNRAEQDPTDLRR